MCFITLVSSIIESATIETAYAAIGNSYIFGWTCITKGKRTFETNTVIPRRIYAAVGNTNIFATVNVDSISIRVNFEVFNSQIINSSCKYSEMTAIQYGEIFQDYISTKFQGNGFIANWCAVRTFSC